MSQDRMFRVIVLGGIALAAGAGCAGATGPADAGVDGFPHEGTDVTRIETSVDQGFPNEGPIMVDAGTDQGFPSELPVIPDSGPDEGFPTELPQQIDAGTND